jgi:hypothetical protein
MSDVAQKKSRRSMIMVLGAFILPIVLAKLALTQNWLEYGVTNKGTLVENELTLEKLGLVQPALQKSWLVIYSLPENCDAHCEQTLLSVNNSYIALGREMPRVKRIALSPNPLSDKQTQRLSENSWTIISTPHLVKNILPQPQVLVVDPLGNVILSHKPPKSDEDQTMFGKEILADMKKLLKYSRVG